MKKIISNQFEQYFERLSKRPYPILKDYHRIKSSSDLKYLKDLSNLGINQVIAKAIVDFESENQSFSIRADAKVLLLINYSNMIYYPLSQAGIFERNNLKDEIYHEVKRILSDASKGEDEISSHKILLSGLKLWNSLKTLGNDSW